MKEDSGERIDPPSSMTKAERSKLLREALANRPKTPKPPSETI